MNKRNVTFDNKISFIIKIASSRERSSYYVKEAI